jgi:hypothetical protein
MERQIDRQTITQTDDQTNRRTDSGSPCLYKNVERGNEEEERSVCPRDANKDLLAKRVHLQHWAELVSRTGRQEDPPQTCHHGLERMPELRRHVSLPTTLHPSNSPTDSCAAVARGRSGDATGAAAAAPANAPAKGAADCRRLQGQGQCMHLPASWHPELLLANSHPAAAASFWGVSQQASPPPFPRPTPGQLPAGMSQAQPVAGRRLAVHQRPRTRAGALVRAPSNAAGGPRASAYSSTSLAGPAFCVLVRCSAGPIPFSIMRRELQRDSQDKATHRK